MTTIIATREKIIADSRLTWGETHHSVNKLFRLSDGTIYATAGDSRLTANFEAQMSVGKPLEPLEVKEGEDFEAVHVTPDGIFIYDENYARFEVRGDYVAIGSGHMVAMSWLKEGAPPELAMEKVMAVDSMTGGAIQTICLSLPKSKRK